VIAKLSRRGLSARSSSLERLSEYDAVLYHIGNDYRYHSEIYRAMQSSPGSSSSTISLYRSFFLGVARQQGRMSIYFDELEACHGRRERLLAEEQLNRGAAPQHEGAPLDFPMKP